MSTGPRPTHKDDGSHDASVDDIADLLVEEDSHKGVVTGAEQSDDGLEVMLETPGPVLATTFLPPPPAPPGLVGEEAEGLEEAGAATNLAYEDLLAKLVLPAKAPESEPTMPAPVEPLPLPETFGAPVAASALPSVYEPVPPAYEPMLPPAYETALPSVTRPSSPNFQIAPPTEERTLVTENPLVAEEQQAAVREGRIGVTRDQPRVVQQEIPPGATEPVATAIGAAKLKYMLFGGLLVLGVMVFSTVFIKLLMPTPAPSAPVMVVAPPVPQPTPVPPAQVQPLPPTPAPATPPRAPAEREQAKSAAASEETSTEQEPEKPQPRPHKREAHPRPAHVAAPKPVVAPKTPAPAPKAAPAAKPAKGGKKGKGAGYADPFDN